MKAFKGASNQKVKEGKPPPRGVAGWIFPLQGGPHEGWTFRLPWSLSRDTFVAYDELPEVFVVGGERYRKTPLFDLKKDGIPLMVKAGDVTVQKVEYRYEAAA